tara:strand:+ start:259 stop:453 length:195 start_codon:yes stop_codon:yes gene_type:complete
MSKTELYTTKKQFEEAHEIAATGRARNVQISRKMLYSLLMDHSEMIRKLGHDVLIVPGENDDNT